MDVKVILGPFISAIYTLILFKGYVKGIELKREYSRIKIEGKG